MYFLAFVLLVAFKVQGAYAPPDYQEDNTAMVVGKVPSQSKTNNHDEDLSLLDPSLARGEGVTINGSSCVCVCPVNVQTTLLLKNIKAGLTFLFCSQKDINEKSNDDVLYVEEAYVRSPQPSGKIKYI